MSVSADARRITAIARRDLQTERTYPIRYIIRFLQAGVSLVIAFYVSKLVLEPPELAGFRGGYFDFVIIGLTVMAIAGLGIGTFNQNITTEQSLGTFEILLSTPTRVPVLLAGSFVFPLLLTVLDMALLLGLGVGLLGDGLPISGLAFAIPLLLLTLATFCAFGIVGASLLVLVKRGDPLTGPLLQLTSILSGALFPVSVLPQPVETLARAFPAYYGITGVREALLGDGGWGDVWPDMAVLAGFAAVLLPLSVRLFSRALAAARRAGTLANY